MPLKKMDLWSFWNRNPSISAWIFAYISAIILDIIGFLGTILGITAWVPPILDFIEFMILFPIIGKYIVLDIPELVPIIALLPMTTIAVFTAHFDLLGWRKS